MLEVEDVSAVATSVTKLEGKRYVGSSLTKSFDGAVVLHDATVTFEPGEIHSIIGENGAGKSTLVKILSGVYQPDSGTLALGGSDLSGSIRTVLSNAGSTSFRKSRR